MTIQPNLNEPQSIPKKKSLWFLLLLFVATVTSGYLFFVQLPVSTTASRFCGMTCHSMNPSYQTWRRSEHATVACLDCHSDGSKTNKFIRFFELNAKHIPREVLEPYKPIKPVKHKMVSEKRCQQCHKPKRRSESAEGRIIDHKAHADAGFNCKTCHNRVSHEDAPEYSPLSKKTPPGPNYANFMTMRKGCWRCHKKGRIFVEPNGKKIAGPYAVGKIVASTDCGICHARYERKQFSKNVRTVWLNHAKQPPWKRGVVHGQMARKTSFAVCKTCHDPKKRCTVCHEGITMPHKVNWLAATEHGGTAKATQGKPCRMCHDLKEVPSCSARGHHHEEFVTALKYDLTEIPWKSGKQRHGPVARATNARPCQRCHERETWCATQCHRGIAMPHGPEWPKTHYKAVGYTPGTGWRGEATPCDICHAPDPNGRDNRTFCEVCHHKEFGPRWIMGAASENGVNQALTTGLGPCAKCHVFKFCWRCHESFQE